MTLIDLNRKTQVKNLGLISYDLAFNLQNELVAQVLDGQTQSIVFCEHPAVLTLGRMTQNEHILVSDQELAVEGISKRAINRGGDVTLHMPGQLVVYPILELSARGRNLHQYLRQLEDVILDVLKHFGIQGVRLQQQTGVWVDKQKIASIGIGIKKWVSFHGFSLNVSCDLSKYAVIKPCGLNVEMTSMQKVIGSALSMEKVKEAVISSFQRIFGIEID